MGWTPGLADSVCSVSSGEAEWGRGLEGVIIGTRLQFSSSTVDVVSVSDFFLTLRSRGCSDDCDSGFTGFDRSYGASVAVAGGLSGEGWDWSPARSRKLRRRPILASMGLTGPTPGKIGLEVWEVAMATSALLAAVG